MKKWPCLVMIFVFLFPGASTEAQNHYDDSLKQVLNQPGLPDSTRISLLIRLGTDLQYGNSGSAKAYFFTACRLAQSKKDRYHEGESLSGLGNVYYGLDKYDSALYYYQKAEEAFRSSSSSEAMESVATTRANMANVQLAHNRYEAAIGNYLEAVRVMEQSQAQNKWVVLGNLYASVATVYHDMNQHDKSLAYDLKGLQAHLRAKHNELLTAYLYLYLSEDYLSLSRLKEARQQLLSAEDLARKVNTPDLYQRLYKTWGELYQNSAQADSAVLYFRKALPYARKIGHVFLIMDNLRMLGYAYRDLKNYSLSENCLAQALSDVRGLGNKKVECELLKNLGLVTARQHKDRAAVSFYQQYIQLNDSLKEADVQKRVNEIEAKYQAKKMKDSLALLHKDLLLRQADLRKKNTQNLGLISGCTMLLLLSGMFYKNLKSKNLLLNQNQELHLHRISEMEKEKRLEVMHAILKGQEEERSRLARDLHDGVGGMLSGVKFSLATMKGNVFISEENAAAFNRALAQLDQSISELRHVSHNMMPESLIRYGLAETLENYCTTLNLTKTVQVQLQTYGLQERFEQSTEIILYRVVQELLTNSMRHGEARNILVQLVREQGHFSLTVEDDGKGFDAESEGHKGAGLTNIRARIAYLNGTIDIRSAPGEGTSVYIEGNCS